MIGEAAASPLSRPFWTALGGGSLAFQRCGDCGRWQHPPQVACAGCGGSSLSWEPVPGDGIVRSSVVVHRTARAELRGATPYIVGLVALDPGPVVLAFVDGSAPLLDARVAFDAEATLATSALVFRATKAPA